MSWVNELAELQVSDGVGCVKDRCRAWHVEIFGGRRSLQLRMGDLEMIDGLSPREVAAVYDVASLKGTGITGKIQGEDMTLGNVTNIDDERRRLGNGAVHDAVDHVVCAESVLGGRAGVYLCVRAEDEPREDCRAF